MGDILIFNPNASNKTKIEAKSRIEALAKGELETYVCDSCGKRFEVMFDNKPEYCPGCFARIRWQ